MVWKLRSAGSIHTEAAGKLNITEENAAFKPHLSLVCKKCCEIMKKFPERLAKFLEIV